MAEDSCTWLLVAVCCKRRVVIIGRAGASPPSRTAAIIFLYIYLYIYIYPTVRFGPRVAPRYAQT